MPAKEEQLQQMEREYESLCKAIAGLDDAQMTRVWCGEWGVREIIAHSLGWEREFGGVLRRFARGERPLPEGVDYADADERNAKFAASAQAISPVTVVATWRQAHMNFVRAARDVPDERFEPKEDGTPSTATRLLEGGGYGHYEAHAGEIREWREREGL